MSATNMTNNRMISRGEIWYADLNYMKSGVKTSVQQGERPVLILQNNLGNKYSPTVKVIPLSTNLSKLGKVEVHVLIPSALKCGLKNDSVALCEQAQTIDKYRLLYWVGRINQNIMLDINKAIMIEDGIEPINDEGFDFNYIRELLLSINELNESSRAKKLLSQEFLKYCKKFNMDYKEIINKLKIQVSMKEVVYA
jgi:mRNA interferase MazF